MFCLYKHRMEQDMVKQKGNMFGSFGTAVQERQREQQKIEATVTSKGTPAKNVGRPRKRQNATSITLVISEADKAKVKAYALKHSITVSDLLHTWIMEHCEKKEYE